MRNNERINGALGLARRAGRCLTGDFAVERAIKNRKVFLVVLDDAVSENTRTRYQALCARKKIQYVENMSVGHAIGKSGIKIVGITDLNFAEMIIRLVNDAEDSEE